MVLTICLKLWINGVVSICKKLKRPTQPGFNNRKTYQELTGTELDTWLGSYLQSGGGTPIFSDPSLFYSCQTFALNMVASWWQFDFISQVVTLKTCVGLRNKRSLFQHFLPPPTFLTINKTIPDTQQIQSPLLDMNGRLKEVTCIDFVPSFEEGGWLEIGLYLCISSLVVKKWTAMQQSTLPVRPNYATFLSIWYFT